MKWLTETEDSEMKTKRLASIAQMLGLIFVVAASESFAQGNPPAYYQLGPAKATLYKPDSGPPPHVGVVAMHPKLRLIGSKCLSMWEQGLIF